MKKEMRSAKIKTTRSRGKESTDEREAETGKKSKHEDTTGKRYTIQKPMIHGRTARKIPSTAIKKRR